jgi:hypothetical protein
MKLEVQVIAVSEVSDIWHGPPLPRRAREAQRVLAPVAPVGPDKDWPAWYAACMAAEQAGTDLLT